MIKHILADGKEVNSVQGMTINPDQCPEYYQALERIVRRISNGENRNIEIKTGVA